MIRKGFLAASAAWLALTGVAAEAQSVAKRSVARPCVSREEAGALFLVVVPGALRGLTELCGERLPGNAYLTTHGAALTKRFEQASARSTANADLAMARMMGLNARKPVAGSAATLAPMGEMMVMAQESKMDDQTCATIDYTLSLLDPLPPENTAGLIVMLMEVGMKREKNPPFTLCPAEK